MIRRIELAAAESFLAIRENVTRSYWSPFFNHSGNRVLIKKKKKDDVIKSGKIKEPRPTFLIKRLRDMIQVLHLKVLHLFN